MIIILRSNIKVANPQEVILRYYSTMGRGVHLYDQTVIPQDNTFTSEQMERIKRLVNGLGERGIPHSAISTLNHRRTEIENRLRQVPATVNIIDDCSVIPWGDIGHLIDSMRVPYLGLARLTKILHKKRPNIIPILDSVMVGYLQPFISREEIVGASDAGRAICYIKELKKDIHNNIMVFTELLEWARKPYPISIIRILDILTWCTLGPFRNRFEDLS